MSLFNDSSIPVIEQVVNFTQARHGLLAGNISNIDTPGYQTRDLSPELFEPALKQAIAKRDQPPKTQESMFPVEMSGGQEALTPEGDFREVAESMKSILYHDESNVAIEKQVTALAKNQAKHNMAISLLVSQFRTLGVAISEQV